MARPVTPPTNAPLAAPESRDMLSFHAFLRASRRFLDGPLVETMRATYERAALPPAELADAMALLDRQGSFQLYQWMYRHLQQFKYSRNDLGILAAVGRERPRLEAALDAAAQAANGELRLDPGVTLPDYYRWVDFHQQPGGVWSDPLAGFVYEMGRRTTLPQHMDPGVVYRILFDALPADRSYDRVLDWGCGTGAGLIEWKRAHPRSEGFGVDVAAPCLKLAHLRAREAGVALAFSQQALERLDFPDDVFDLAFHMFMLHEIAPAALPTVLKEAARVLKPGGLLAGPEFHLTPGDPFYNVVQMSHAWTNNETYSVAWFGTDIESVARTAGFAKVSITPYTESMTGKGRPGAGGRPKSGRWNLYVFEK